MLNCDSLCVWQAIRLVVTAGLGLTIIGLAFGAGYMYRHAAPRHCSAAASGCPPVVPPPRPIAQPPSMAPTAAPAPTPFPAPAATAPPPLPLQAIASAAPAPKAPSPKAS